VTEPPWVGVEPLAAHHDTATFVSGRESVDAWFRDKALANAHTVSTYVCVDEQAQVCAFFALRAIVVNVSAAPGRLKRAGDDEGMAPAVLLAQMGVHERHQRQGHGSRLFFRAVQEAVTAYTAIRIPLLVLDAADEDLVSFYEKLAMKRIPNTLRLAALIHKIPPPSGG
jgi:GNAT superfamily N-acetyltransferase